MKFISILLFFPLVSYSQFYPTKIGEVTGLVKYSIVSQDPRLVLDTNSSDFQSNYIIEIQKQKHMNRISKEKMRQIVFSFCSLPKTSIHSKRYVWRDSISNEKIKLVLRRKQTDIPIQMFFIKDTNEWYIKSQKITHYFYEDSIVPKRILVFINGYRGYEREDNETDNLVTTKDRYHYWFKLDDRFIDTLQPDRVFYLDGSMSIKTSNHRNTIRFLKSFFLSNHFINRKNSTSYTGRLNKHPNEEGFYYRREKGRVGGATLQLNLHPKDTVDFVCHSMGYAYGLGVLDVIDSLVSFGKMYILSPENGCQDGFEWSKFQEVWQYGSNLDQPNPDPIWEQDGIAPQCQVKGLFFDQNHGRAFIPKDWPKKNFVDSHMPYNYDWIFDRIKKGEAGFIAR